MTSVRWTIVATLALAGCKIYSGAKPGSNGQLSFYEPNDYPGETETSAFGFERPIALGARADVWLLGPGLGTVQSAKIDDPDIVSLSFISYPIRLQARAVGTTTLRVVSSNGTDSLPISVAAPDRARVWIVTSQGLLQPGDSFFGKGYALRPGASLRIAGQPMAGSNGLLGYDLLDWSVDPTLLSASDGGSTVNTLSVKGLGVSGTTTISTQLGGSVEVTTLSASDVPVLKLYSFAASMSSAPEVAAITSADLQLFYLGVTDAAGHVVKTSLADEATFSVSVVDGDVTVLEAQHGGHGVSLRACAGSGHVRIAYLGAERVVPIEVSAAAADASCP
jgi:hypothetical protein